MFAYLKCFLPGFIAEHQKIPFLFLYFLKIFLDFSLSLWQVFGVQELLLGCQDAAVTLARMQFACSHRAAANCHDRGRKDEAGKPWLVPFSWLLACIETNKYKCLNFLYASVHFGWHICFGKQNSCWKFAASADGASRDRGVGLEVVCVHQDCDCISCRSVSFVGVIQGLKRCRWNFSWFCSYPNKALQCAFTTELRLYCFPERQQ